jgi:hypothetical protein
MMLPAEVSETVGRFLHTLDRVIPGRVEGFYLIGSTALGAFRQGRSDIDFVAVLAKQLQPGELRELRRTVQASGAHALARDAVLGRRWPLVCNGVYVTKRDLASSSLLVEPAAAHVAGRYTTGHAFEVNPVTWHTLAHHGITIRGPTPDALSIFVDDLQLRDWTLTNLNTHWRDWTKTAHHRVAPGVNPFYRRGAAWGVLGAPRLHRTVCAAEIISKESAGRYALRTFSKRWHPIIRDALAYWGGSQGSHMSPFHRQREATRFVERVIADANVKVFASQPHGSGGLDNR